MQLESVVDASQSMADVYRAGPSVAWASATEKLLGARRFVFQDFTTRKPDPTSVGCLLDRVAHTCPRSGSLRDNFRIHTTTMHRDHV
jgi:hypothetical protein